MCPHCLVMHLPIAVKLYEGKANRKVNAVSTSSAGFHSLLPVLYCHDTLYGLTENDWLEQAGGSQSHTFPNIKSICYFTVMGDST